MKAITFAKFGEPSVLTITEQAKPVPKSEELLVEVRAVGMNRADLLQRRGKYPPPEGASNILGIEIAGDVVACGEKVTRFKPGDRVFGLVSGGGYAEYCVLDHELALTIPTHWSYADAAAIIEAFVTANETIFELGELSSGQRIMIHAGGSGVGTAGIQMAHFIGADIWTTAGSEEKLQKAIALGAIEGINYKIQDFDMVVLEKTHGVGVDVVEDFIGAGYFEKNLSILKPGGRLIQVGLMRGSHVSLDLRMILDRHVQIKGFILRKRSLAEKRAMVKRFSDRWMSVLEAGKIKPVIDVVFPITAVKEAHDYMESNSHFGKVVLSWEDML